MEMWARKFPVILPKFRLPLKFRDLLDAANLRHGTDGFTFLGLHFKILSDEIKYYVERITPM